MTLGGNDNPITFTGPYQRIRRVRQHHDGPGSNSITLGGAITGTGLADQAGDGYPGAFRHQHHELPGLDEHHGGYPHHPEQQCPGDRHDGTIVCSGATLQVQGGVTSSEPIALVGTGAGGMNGAARAGRAGNTATGTVSGAITLLGDTEINVGSGQLTLSGAISGAGGLNKLGSGVLSLSAANSYTGPVTVSAGILEANNATALGSITAGTTVLDGATLQLTPSAATTYVGEDADTGRLGVWPEPIGIGELSDEPGRLNNNASVTNTWTGNIILDSAPGDSTTLSNGTTTGTLFISGIVSGVTSLVKVGSGALTLAAPNTFTGSLERRPGHIDAPKQQRLHRAHVYQGPAGHIDAPVAGKPWQGPARSTWTRPRTLKIDDSTMSVSNRLGSSNIDLNLNGGNLSITGSSTAGVVSSESLGPITLTGGNSVITSNSGAGNGSRGGAREHRPGAECRARR